MLGLERNGKKRKKINGSSMAQRTGDLGALCTSRKFSRDVQLSSSYGMEHIAVVNKQK